MMASRYLQAADKTLGSGLRVVGEGTREGAAGDDVQLRAVELVTT